MSEGFLMMPLVLVHNFFKKLSAFISQTIYRKYIRGKLSKFLKFVACSDRKTTIIPNTVHFVFSSFAKKKQIIFLKISLQIFYNPLRYAFRSQDNIRRTKCEYRKQSRDSRIHCLDFSLKNPQHTFASLLSSYLVFT